jgi:small subunit ribosomal protein S1
METVLKEEKSKSYKEFEKSLAEDLGSRKLITGEIVTGIVEEIGRKYILIDIGGKSSGAVPVEEFKRANELDKISKGSKVKVFLSSLENRSGEIVISFEQAKKVKAWNNMKRAFENKEEVTGTIISRVKGGFAVSVDSCICFLPSSQVSNRPIKDMSSIMKTPQTFECVKLDERRGNIVLSRRQVIERIQNKDKS